MSKIPLVIYTAPPTEWCLPGLMWLLEYQTRGKLEEKFDLSVYGFDQTDHDLFTPFVHENFRSLGDFNDYPIDRWSDSFLRILENLAWRQIENFVFMLEDYWPIRGIDVLGIELLYGYASASPDVMKIDLARDRLNADVGRYSFDYNTAFSLGHLDVIEAQPTEHYYVSLWGGILNTQQWREIVVPGEKAQEVEMNGTYRVSRDMLRGGKTRRVLGTRQGPMIHDNIVHNGKFFQFGHNRIPKTIIDAMHEQGVLDAELDYPRD